MDLVEIIAGPWKNRKIKKILEIGDKPMTDGSRTLEVELENGEIAIIGSKQAPDLHKQITGK